MRIAILITTAVLGLAYLAVGPPGGDACRGGPGAQDLIVAIDRGDIEAINAAVSSGTDVNVGFGEITPLKRAVFNGREDVVVALVRLGADVNAVGPTGRTPLAIALMEEDPTLAEVLRANGAVPAQEIGR